MSQSDSKKAILHECRASLEVTAAHLTNTCRLQRSTEANGNADHTADTEQSVMLLSELPQVKFIILHSCPCL